MTTRQLLSRFFGIILGAGLASVAVGIGVGIATYQALYDPASTAGFANLGVLFLSVVGGAAVTYATYVVLSLLAVSRYMSGAPISMRIRLLVAPLILLALSVGLSATAYVRGFAILGGALALTLVIVSPVGTFKLRAQVLVAVIVALVVVAVAGISGEKANNDRTYAASIAKWNGPLMLIDGTAIDLPDSGWTAGTVEAPSSNDDYESADLIWRQQASDDAGSVIEASLFNTPAASGCEYDSCTSFGSSNYGPVFQSRTTGDLVVAVPKGHLELTYYGFNDPIALINSLQSVDAQQFVLVTHDRQL